jgi:hypothetical protein
MRWMTLEGSSFGRSIRHFPFSSNEEKERFRECREREKERKLGERE